MDKMNTAQTTDVYEVVFTKFKEGTTLDAQIAAMAQLNDVVSQFEGFKSRNYFYSEENKHWVDMVVWTDVERAKRASEQAMANPTAGEVFMLMDESAMIFSHYHRQGGIAA